MAVFFLFVGLEIKREVETDSWKRWVCRTLLGAAALGGMAAPAVVFMLLNWNDLNSIRGWAIPAATDIAFALAVLTLLGSRIPVSLRIFLTALAIIDDLGAVAIIAFLHENVSFLYLGLAVTITALLANMNRTGIVRLWPYLFLGAVLWFCVFRSGIHATVAGVGEPRREERDGSGRVRSRTGARGHERRGAGRRGEAGRGGKGRGAGDAEGGSGRRGMERELEGERRAGGAGRGGRAAKGEAGGRRATGQETAPGTRASPPREDGAATERTRGQGRVESSIERAAS